jgi:surface-anchored protein
MKKVPFILSLIAVVAVATVTAKDKLTNQHVDVGVAYEDGEWDLHVHNETDDVEYEPGDIVLPVGVAAKTTVPADPNYAFLGAAGSSLWVLPEIEDPALIFLGLGTEEIPNGVFLNNQLTVRLLGVKGAGDFALFTTDAFGLPVVHFNTRDGVDSADAMNLVTASHRHANWTFSKPGRYRVIIEASGTLVSGETISSGPVAYLFHVENRGRVIPDAPRGKN